MICISYGLHSQEQFSTQLNTLHLRQHHEKNKRGNMFWKNSVPSLQWRSRDLENSIPWQHMVTQHLTKTLYVVVVLFCFFLSFGILKTHTHTINCPKSLTLSPGHPKSWALVYKLCGYKLFFTRINSRAEFQNQLTVELFLQVCGQYSL